jgi:SAM-dependent methyltransferase
MAVRRPSRIIKKIYKSMKGKSFIPCLKKELIGSKSILDVGCGMSSPIRFCSVSYSIGVDLFRLYLMQAKRNKIHDDYVLGDVRKLCFRNSSFDCVAALDLIEHLSKAEGYNLLREMERVARKKIIVFTPNGYLRQDAYDNNAWQAHKSSWSVRELKNQGYKVNGINGLYTLRGYMTMIRFKPTRLWKDISDMTQKATYYIPEFAFQLLCVKIK